MDNRYQVFSFATEDLITQSLVATLIAEQVFSTGVVDLVESLVSMSITKH